MKPSGSTMVLGNYMPAPRRCVISLLALSKHYETYRHPTSCNIQRLHGGDSRIHACHAAAEAGRDHVHPTGEVYKLIRPEPHTTEVPLVLGSPHSGTQLPSGHSFRTVASQQQLRTTEDSYVDELFQDASKHGAVLVAALFPRWYIDPNRAIDDLDPDLLVEPWPKPLAPGPKTRSGLGLVRRLVKPDVPIYGEKLPVADVATRIACCYVPYHAALQAELDRLYAQHHKVWFLDCHSMKSVGNGTTPDGPMKRPDVVLGDRKGTSCSPELTREVAAALTSMGYSVQVNWPYQGAYSIQKHGRPQDNRHALQIEVNRVLYMDEETRERHDGFVLLQQNMTLLLAMFKAFIEWQLAG